MILKNRIHAVDEKLILFLHLNKFFIYAHMPPPADFQRETSKAQAMPQTCSIKPKKMQFFQNPSVWENRVLASVFRPLWSRNFAQRISFKSLQVNLLHCFNCSSDFMTAEKMFENLEHWRILILRNYVLKPEVLKRFVHWSLNFS